MMLCLRIVSITQHLAQTYAVQLEMTKVRGIALTPCQRIHYAGLRRGRPK